MHVRQRECMCVREKESGNEKKRQKKKKERRESRH